MLAVGGIQFVIDQSPLTGQNGLPDRLGELLPDLIRQDVEQALAEEFGRGQEQSGWVARFVIQDLRFGVEQEQ